MDQWLRESYDADRGRFKDAMRIVADGVEQLQREIDEMLQFIISMPDEAVDAISDDSYAKGQLSRFKVIAAHTGIEARR